MHIEPSSNLCHVCAESVFDAMEALIGIEIYPGYWFTEEAYEVIRKRVVDHSTGEA